VSLRDRVAGVDFSGAREAGKNIWIAEGLVTAAGVKIKSLCRAADLPGGGTAFAPAMSALVEHVATLSDHVVGFDFPFSLPALLVTDNDWPSYVRHFAADFETADSFREHCRTQTGGREYKRATDTEARVPWCAYNLRLYRQTWAGIRHVLHPLTLHDRARIIPIQKPLSGIPLIAEICPASTLKAEDLYGPYKGRGDDLRIAREGILESVTRRGLLSPLHGTLRDTILDNTGGDALDAVLSAIAAARIKDPAPRGDLDLIECRVYF
jgi:hypothetical protein